MLLMNIELREGDLLIIHKILCGNLTYSME